MARSSQDRAGGGFLSFCSLKTLLTSPVRSGAWGKSDSSWRDSHQDSEAAVWQVPRYRPENASQTLILHGAHSDRGIICLKRPSYYCLIHFYKRCVSSLAWQVSLLWVRSGWVSVLFSHKPSLFRAKESPLTLPGLTHTRITSCTTSQPFLSICLFLPCTLTTCP